jgi:hypothetical protein
MLVAVPQGNEKTALARQSTPGLRFMCILVPWVPSLSVVWPFLMVETGSGPTSVGRIGHYGTFPN